MDIQIIQKYFTELTPKQVSQFSILYDLYVDWNEKINVISRKDIDSLYEKHVLHSLAIAKYVQFKPKTKILDLGTGGGFPGIPLAIFFPDSNFTLVDSIAKKVNVAEDISENIGLINTDFVIGRAEMLKEKFDFVVSRAVAPMDKLYRWTQSYIKPEGINLKFNGYLLLKGGSLKEEKQGIKAINRKLRIEEVNLSTYFEEEFFETKKLVHIY